VIAALLEHHQQPDGSVRLPAPLRAGMGADVLA
jgi:seryl-tRNA synthetase